MVWPQVDIEYVLKIIKYMQQVGFTQQKYIS